VVANHPSNERYRAFHWQAKLAAPAGKQNLPPKTPEMPILLYYFAFRDRN
jgi:hypothetical protein